MVVAFVGRLRRDRGDGGECKRRDLALVCKDLRPGVGAELGCGAGAPFTEELAKGSGLLLLIAMAPRQVRTAFDGFILGAFIGLGFQIIEDITYALTSAGTQFGANQIGASIGTIVLRMVSGVAAHILYSAIFCAGVVIWLAGREPRKVGRGLLWSRYRCCSTGVGLVGFHRRPERAGAIGLLIAAIVVALMIFARVYRLTVNRQGTFVRDVMAPDRPDGAARQLSDDRIIRHAR